MTKLYCPVEESWRARPAGRWGALALLSITLVLSMTTWFSAAAVLPQLRRQWDLGSSESA